MKPFPRIAVSVACVAAVWGAAFAWQDYRAKCNARKLAEEARVYRTKAENGDAEAQAQIGSMYYYGRGSPQDYAEAQALRWYRKAANQGDEYALRALGVELTIFGKFGLAVQLLGGVWLLLDFLSSDSLPGASLQDFRQKVVIGGGILGIFCAGLSLYGYTHNKIRCLTCGLDTFNLSRWLLNLAWIALLVYIVRSGI